jgi:hypothetical protein|tara:strand:+ start:6639 stop:8612 length:1974 start_codon:yes stop_codon:yes gene_type:complete
MENTHFIDKEPNKYEALAELHNQQIRSMNEDQGTRLLSNLENAWGLHEKDFLSHQMLGYNQYISNNCFNEYGAVSINDIDLVAIKTIRKKNLDFAVELRNHMNKMKKEKMKNGDTKDDDSLSDELGLSLDKRIANIILHIEDGYENIRRHYISYERVSTPTVQPQFPKFSDPSAMDDEEIESISPYQKCLLYTLEETYKCGYRRYKGHCCEEIKTIEGYRTRAWNPIFPIDQFVYSIAQKDSSFTNWKNFTSKGSIFREVIDHVSKCKDQQFPEISKRRHVWSFKNGLFVGKEWIPDRGVYDCRFYPYESSDFACLDPTIVSCKYFDQQFDDFSHLERWQDIPTPNFDKVLKYQKLDQEVCDWAYVMGGRLCYDVGELDSWQIIPFFKGIARSGKSTLITKVFKKFYESEDVGVLANNIEKKFGLSAIKDNFMFIAPEIKSDLGLEQAEFQSIVSGEDVSIAVKNKTAVSIEWNVPGVLGGNEVPNWKDNSGSILRRILPWNFTKQVREADPQLDEKLNRELPIILLKCVRGYLDYSNKYRDRDIWNVVPKYFEIIKKQVAMVASTLTNFLESTSIKYGEELCVPQTIFVQMFNQHCSANNLGKPKFNQDFYVGPFSSRDIEVREEIVKYKGRTYPKQPVIFGLDVIEESIGFTEDY